MPQNASLYKILNFSKLMLITCSLMNNAVNFKRNSWCCIDGEVYNKNLDLSTELISKIGLRKFRALALRQIFVPRCYNSYGQRMGTRTLAPCGFLKQKTYVDHYNDKPKLTQAKKSVNCCHILFLKKSHGVLKTCRVGQ